MVDNELLLAMSEMMDGKLQPIKEDLAEVKEEQKEMKKDLAEVKEEQKKIKEDLAEVKEEQKEMKKDLAEVKEEQKKIKEDLAEVKEEQKEMKKDLAEVKEEQQKIKDDLQGVKNEVHRINLYQENVIQPRLETIESCYTDTYNRYKSDADKMEAAFKDIELLKTVVSEHSKQLQRLA